MPAQREEGSTQGQWYYGTMTEWLLGRSADLGSSHSAVFLATAAKHEVNQAQEML